MVKKYKQEPLSPDDSFAKEVASQLKEVALQLKEQSGNLPEDINTGEEDNNSSVPAKGRPPKKPPVVENEGGGKLRMSHDETEADLITLQSLQDKWRNAFSKYGSHLSFETTAKIWQKNFDGLKNPFNQNLRTKKINTLSKEYTKDEVRGIVSTPEIHEQDLRAISWWMYYTNYVYQTLTKLNRDVPKYNYYYTPLYVAPGSNDSVKNDSERLDKLMKLINPPLTFKTIATQVQVEGKATYLVRLGYNKKNPEHFVFQKLDSDNVKITGFGSDQKFIVSFNMAIFLNSAYSVDMYPDFIKRTWEYMTTNGIVSGEGGTKKIVVKKNLPKGHFFETGESGTYFYWVELPQDIAYTFYSDGSNSNAFPDMLGLLPSFATLADYEWLEGSLVSRGVSAILTGEVPMIQGQQLKMGADQTALSPDLIVSYTDLFNSIVSDNIQGYFAPFTNYKLHELTTDPDNMNIVQERIKELVASSGQTGLISLTDKPSIISVKTAQKLQAARAEYITKQFEQCLNSVINSSYELKNVWGIHLFGDIFTDEDNVKVTKELVMTAGAKGLIPKLLSYEGLTLEDYHGAEIYLKALGIEIKSDAQKLSEQAEEDNVDMQEKTLAANKENAKIAAKSAEKIADKNAAAKPATAGSTSKPAVKTSTSTSSNASTAKKPAAKAPTPAKKVGRPAKSDSEVENDNTGASKSAGTNDSKTK